MPIEDAVIDSAVETPEAPAADVMDNLTAEAPANDAPDTDPAAEPATDPVAADAAPEGDGRTLPADFKNLLNGLKATNPNLEKTLRGLFFANRAFKEKFPNGLAEAVKLKESYDQLGGEAGVQAIAAERAEWAALDQQFEQGSPQFVENIAQQSPEAFAKMMPHALSQLAKVDKDAYARTLGGIISATAQNSGLLNSMFLAKQLLSLGKTDEAVAHLDAIENWFGELNKLATQEPAKPAPDAKLQERETALEQREQRLFNDSVNRGVTTARTTAIQNEVKALTSGKGLDEERLEILSQSVLGKLDKALRADPDFTKKFNQFVAAKDSAKIVELVNGKSAKMLPEMVKAQYRLLFGRPGTPAPKPKVEAPGARPASSEYALLGRRPTPEEIDYSRTPRELLHQRKAILTNGRKVQWA